MSNREQIQEQLQNDPFIKLWKNNYNNNLNKKLLSSTNAKPLIFLINNLPYHNIPIILIVAGPSIDKNIQYLKDYENNCIIICADVVLFKLIEHNIKPDFVVNVDPHESIIRFWHFLDTSDLTLVCPTTTNPKTITAWHGKKFFYNQTDIEGTPKGDALKKIVKPTKNWGNIFNRFFIGATMLQLATILRPSSVILAGYDFGFTDEKAYCDGFLDLKIYYLEEPEGSSGWIRVMEKLKSEEVKKEVKIQVSPVKTIWSTNALLIYKKTFLQLTEKVNFPIINSTEGGILTELPRIPLKQSLKENCTNPIEKKDIFMLKKRKKRKKK